MCFTSYDVKSVVVPVVDRVRGGICTDNGGIQLLNRNEMGINERIIAIEPSLSLLTPWAL